MSGFKLNLADLIFVLKQIKIAEANAAGTPLTEIWVDKDGNIVPAGTPGATLAVPSPMSPYGLRTVDGTYNNIVPGRETWGSADQVMPRLFDVSLRNDGDGDTFDANGPAPGGLVTNTNYASAGNVADADPRIISNLVADQSVNNPAAIAAWFANPLSVAHWEAEHPGKTPVAPGAVTDPLTQVEITNADLADLPNLSPDIGLSPSFNAWMTFFGQFFDHGLDLISKGGNGTVFVPLQADDPLMTVGVDGIAGTGDELSLPQNAHLAFMALTRSTPINGTEARNTTTPFVDQNQTYTSHPSHQVFLREYKLDANNKPVATGELLNGAASDGLPTWAEVKAQARMLGIALDDRDVGSVPLIRTDLYGKFIPDPVTGMAQLVIGLGADGIPNTADDIVASGTPENPISTWAVGAVRTIHAFLDDIAHNAAPVVIGGVLQADADATVGNAVAINPQTGQKLQYDNELLDRHFITGDGRGNENIGLTTVHHVFHSEHNRQVHQQQLTLLQAGDLAFLNEWLLTDITQAQLNATANMTPLQLSAFAETLNWDGERLFQAGRFATEMQYQHLVFEEFARRINPNIDAFVFNSAPDINPAIFAEFAHTVYRFGHSMLTDDVPRLDADGNPMDPGLGLIEAFLNPVLFDHDQTISADEAAGSVIRGMTIEAGNEIDEFVVNALRSNLLGLPLDLAALNIARGRDAGVATLNEARQQLYAATSSPWVKPYANWVEFTANLKTSASVVNFMAAYGRHPSIVSATTLEAKRDAAILLVFGGAGAPSDRLDYLNSTGAWSAANSGLNEIDLWIGGLAEKIMPFGGMLGSTFTAVFEAQLENLQDGDRFYYLTRNQGQNLLNSLEQNAFSKLILANTDLAQPGPDGIRGTPDDIVNRHIGTDVFLTYDYVLEVNPANQVDYTAATAAQIEAATQAVTDAQGAYDNAVAANAAAQTQAAATATNAATTQALANATDAAALRSAANAAATTAAGLNTTTQLGALMTALVAANATDAVALQAAANAAQAAADATDASALQSAADNAAADDAAAAAAQTIAGATNAADLQAQADAAVAADEAASAAQALADATDAAALQLQVEDAAADDAAAAAAQADADTTNAADLQAQADAAVAADGAASAAQALADATDVTALQLQVEDAVADDAAAAAAQADADVTDAADLQAQADAAVADDGAAIAAQALADATDAVALQLQAEDALADDAAAAAAQADADATDAADLQAQADAALAADQAASAAQALADATDAAALQLQVEDALLDDLVAARVQALADATDAGALQAQADAALAAGNANEAARLQALADDAAAADSVAAQLQELANATDAVSLQTQADAAAAADAALPAAQALAEATDAVTLQGLADEAAAADSFAAQLQDVADATDALSLQTEADAAAAADADALTAQALADETDAVALQGLADEAAAADGFAAQLQEVANATDAASLQSQVDAAAAADADALAAQALADETDAVALQGLADEAAAADGFAAQLQDVADATDAVSLQTQADAAAAADAALPAALALADATDAVALQASADDAAAADSFAAQLQAVADATDAVNLQAQAQAAAAADAAAPVAQAAAAAAIAADNTLMTALNGFVAAFAADQAADAAAVSADAAADAAEAADAAAALAQSEATAAAAVAVAAASAESSTLATLTAAQGELDVLVTEGTAPGVDPVGADPTLEALGMGMVQRGENYLKYTGENHVVLGGSSADDTLLGGNGIDAVWGDDGNDRIDAGMEVDLVFGGGGNDVITDQGGGDGDFLKGEEGDDVIANGSGIDIMMGGSGSDAIFVGVDGAEVFAGEGNDFVLGGNGADVLLGFEGDDWIEGGAGFDGIDADMSELNFDSRIVGHDVMFAGSDEQDFEGETGDDIMVQGESVIRNGGQMGFDWVTYKGVEKLVDADMGIPIFTTEQADILRNRFDKVEGMSGWKNDDILTGDDRIYGGPVPFPTAGAAGLNFQRDELNQEGIDRIAGLDQIVTADLLFEGAYGSDWSDRIEQIFSGGNVLLGGGGSDVITGRGGNDIIDGDKWLNVRIRITEPGEANDAANEIATIDSLQHVFGAGAPAAWVGKSLYELMVDRVIVSSQMHIVREILDGNVQGDVDTAVFWDVLENYTITGTADGAVTVNHTGFAAATVAPGTFKFSDGIDTLRNIEQLRFGDGLGGFVTFDIGRFIPFAATGTPVISDTTPLEGQTLSVDVSSIFDRNGLGAFAYAWQSSVDGVTWTNIAGATGATFAVPDALLTGVTALAGQFLRVEVSFTDGLGDVETLVSASTGPVGINYDALVGLAVNFTARAGDDTLNGSLFGDTLNGNAGNDTIDGRAGADTLSGGAGNDVISGGTGNDTISGDAGDDLLTGGAGNDTISGGDGIDTVQYAGSVTNFIVRTGGVGNVVLGTDNVGNEGVDTLQTHEFVRFAGVDYALVWDTSGNGNNAVNGLEGADGNQMVFGLGGADTLRGGAGSDILVSGFGNDTVLGGDGDDFIFQNGDETGRDLIDGGAGTDYYIMGGVAGAETFRIYTKAAAEAAGMTGLAANTEIVITRNGTTNASIVAQLDNIEEIKINTLNSTANNGNNATAPDGGAATGGSVANATGDTVIVIGDFTQTSLDYSTITVAGTDANDTIDISGLTSAHRLVFESNGGADTIVGQVRTQDVFQGEGLNDLRTGSVAQSGTGIEQTVGGTDLSDFGSTDVFAGLSRAAIREMLADQLNIRSSGTGLQRVDLGSAESADLSNFLLLQSGQSADLGLTMVDMGLDIQPLDLVTPADVQVSTEVNTERGAFDHRFLSPTLYDILPF